MKRKRRRKEKERERKEKKGKEKGEKKEKKRKEERGRKEKGFLFLVIYHSLSSETQKKILGLGNHRKPLYEKVVSAGNHFFQTILIPGKNQNNILKSD